ncbi:unnamed protein product [Mesocestoides corti]|uniref:Sfi1 domain-containing protein n=1 Tax=Mesocestoides corti TaxID=53468 RepID=A0A0R3U7M6_MESCO|nr:unnamed protein product [Mesocestoides corti]
MQLSISWFSCRFFSRTKLALRVFRALKSFTIISNQRRALMAVVGHRHREHLLHTAFICWSACLDGKSREDSIASRSDKKLLAKALRVWVRHCQGLRKAADKTCAVVLHYQMTLLRRCMQSWMEFYARRNELKAFVVHFKVSLVTDNSQYLSAPLFTMWCFCEHFGCSHRFPESKDARLLRATFREWVSMIARQRRIHRCYLSACALRQKHIIRRFFSCWHQYTLKKAGILELAEAKCHQYKKRLLEKVRPPLTILAF